MKPHAYRSANIIVRLVAIHNKGNWILFLREAWMTDLEEHFKGE